LILESLCVSISAAVSVTSGMQGSGAVLQSGITHISDCIVQCKASSSCLGFDYITSDNTCWFHYISTICNELTNNINSVHFSFYDCSKSVHFIEILSRNSVHVIIQHHQAPPHPLLALEARLTSVNVS
jgi:hypothetical protein